MGRALGTQGLTAAATAADTGLHSGEILRVPKAVYPGRRVMRNAREGIWVSHFLLPEPAKDHKNENDSE